MRAIPAHHGFRIPEEPFIKETVKVHAALAPLVVYFVHHQKAHLIAQVIEIFRHGVMGAADGVDAQWFECFQPPHPYFPWHGRTERTAVMVHINAPKLCFDPVEQEAVFSVKHGAAHAKTQNMSRILVQLQPERIQFGRIGRPEGGFGKHKVKHRHFLCRLLALPHRLALFIQHHGIQGMPLRIARNLCRNMHLGLIAADAHHIRHIAAGSFDNGLRRHRNAVMDDIGHFIRHQKHLAVDAGAAVPAVTAAENDRIIHIAVVHTDGQKVAFPEAHMLCQIAYKGHITIGSSAHMHAV